jgi:hypothetical protein
MAKIVKHPDINNRKVGIGDPEKAQKMGGDIFKITEKYDDMVLEYLKLHKETKYFFLSSSPFKFALLAHSFNNFILRLKSEKLYSLLSISTFMSIYETDISLSVVFTLLGYSRGV